MKTLKRYLSAALKKHLSATAFSRLKMLSTPGNYINFAGGWVGKVTFNEDGMATAHNSDFTKSHKFIEAYRLGEETESWGPVGRPPLRWRVFNACTLAKYALRVPGDFVECGTNKGAVATAIISYTNFEKAKKKFYLLDTYEGFDQSVLSETESALINSSAFRYADCYAQVKAHFKQYSFVEIIKGSVPSTLPQVHSDKIAFLHLDMNCALPERKAIEYFWDKITPGGVVLLDDYGWEYHEEQKATLDEFALTKGIEVVEMPTGQGLILKPYF
jgi:O-methyltransferase